MESKRLRSDYFKKITIPAQITTFPSEKNEILNGMIKRIDELLEE